MIAMDFARTLAEMPLLAGLRAVHCRHLHCRRWLTQRHLETRRAGIRLGDDWFCSIACITSALTERITQLGYDHRSSTPYNPGMTLGMILVRRGFLTYEQWQTADNAACATGTDAGDTLIERGLVEEKDVLSARAMQWGVPVFTAPQSTAPLPIRIPTALQRRYSLVPMHYVPATGNLLIGFRHRVEYSALYAIETITACRTQSCFISAHTLTQQTPQDTTTTPDHSDELILEPASSPRAAATLLGSLSADFDADEILISRCRDFLWARLRNASHTRDILFPA